MKSKNELFLNYLIEVNTIEEDSENKRDKKREKKIVKFIESLIIYMIGISIGLITIWHVAQEVLMKLRF